MDPVEVERCFLAALSSAPRADDPYPHWTPAQPLPLRMAAALADLPVKAAAVGETLGRRETHNATRIFLGPASAYDPAACTALAEAFQSPATVAGIAAVTGADLAGAYLRIEYCVDRDGFWLEPHTDIGVKRFTLLIYLSRGPGSQAWGTDVCLPDGALHSRARADFNTGLVFVPAADTWHGFARRPIMGERRTVIVNYVGPEWRARHELAFPERTVA